MFEKIIDKISKSECVGIFTHVNPDGDALGSAYSLRRILTRIGKRAEAYICGSVEPCIRELCCVPDGYAFDKEECDFLISVDSADLSRLGEYSDFFSGHDNTAAIDHHVTHKEYAEATVVGDISSNCELMYSLYREMDAEIDVETASYLYIGICTDTGNFKFSSVTGDTHRVAAELIGIGVPFADIAKRIFDTVTREYLALQCRAIEAMQFRLGGRMAILVFSNKDFEECGIDEAAANSIVALPGKIEGVEVGVYIRQRTDKEYKVSLRSSGKADVSEIASVFGGGGHIKAAGYSIFGNVDESLEALTEEIRKRI